MAPRHRPVPPDDPPPIPSRSGKVGIGIFVALTVIWIIGTIVLVVGIAS